MIVLTKVKLGAFGCFRNAEFDLKEGFNIICGSNEAGKSTLAAAIGATLFGLRRERERYIPWDGDGRCEAEVTFSVGGREMVIARDFVTDRVRACEREGDAICWRFDGKVSPLGRSSEREDYLAKIEEIWGFSEGDIFRNSVHVCQRDIAIDGSGGLGARLQHLLSGFADTDHERVVAGLEEELYSLTKKPGGRAKDRQLEEIRARISELGTLWQEARKAQTDLELQEARLAEQARWLEEARRDHEKGRMYLGRVRKHHELLVHKEQLERAFGKLVREREKVSKLLERQNGLEVQLAGVRHAASLPDDFPAHDEAYRHARERRAALTEEIGAFDAGGKVARKGRFVVAFGIGAAWAVAAAATYLGARHAALMYVAAFFATIGGALSLHRANLAASRRGERLDEMQGEMSVLEATIASFESRFPAGTVAAADEFVVATRNDAVLREVVNTLEDLPGLAALTEEEGELRRELAVVAERLEAISSPGFPLLSAEEVVAAEEKMRRLEAEISEREQEYREQEQEVAVLRRTSVDIGPVEEEGEELREREVRVAGRVKALQLALEVLRETIDEYRSAYLSRLAREAEGVVARLTAGRYRETSIDADLNVSLSVKGELRPVEMMSCGVQDQAYIGARLALGRILSRGKKLPFLLDDPLVNFDDERRAAALGTLASVAAGHQVILFVHDPRYLKVKGADGWHKIRLESRREDHGQLHLL